MKLLRLLCCVSALALAGCATSPLPNIWPGSPSQSSTKNQVPSKKPASNAPPETANNAPALYPSGPLQPIANSQAGQHNVADVQAPADLWDRIRRGYSMPDLDNDLVRDREQWYASRPDYIQRMTERSSKYLFHIVEELERRNMPTELALLPFIESAFNPQAVSSAKAAGMWQFMPATGNYFDLKQNVFRDDRRDVLASTRAALDYLQKLHGMFGDWHLALAAYNWGEGSVSRAIARNEKQGLGGSYTELSMPAETRLYVPKLQAVKNIIGAPERFSTDLPLIANHPYFQSVSIDRDIDVALVARLAGISEKDFRSLNPSLHKPVILAAGMPQILLPWDNAQVFRKNLRAYDEGQYASWTVWTVPSTMSVSAAAQRAGMSEGELRQLNNIPPRMLIKAGSALMVPRANDSHKDVSGHVADNGQIAFTPEIVITRTTVRARKKESVASIAQRFNVKTSDVLSWNRVKPNSLFKAGQSVVMYLPMRVGTASRASSSTRLRASSSNTPSKATASSQRSGKRSSASSNDKPRKTAAATSNKKAAAAPTKRKR